MAPGFVNHLLLICQFELKRLFFTRKGLLYLFTFAIVWGLILWFPIRYASGLLEPGRSVNSGSFFAFLGFGSLLNWQIPEFGVYWHFALIIFPILCVIVTADQTSSDRDRGTLRFLALRANRDSIFFWPVCWRIDDSANINFDDGVHHINTRCRSRPRL